MHLKLPKQLPLITEKMVEEESRKFTALLATSFSLNRDDNATEQKADIDPIMYAFHRAITDNDLAVAIMHAVRMLAYEKLANGWEDYELIRTGDAAPANATKH